MREKEKGHERKGYRGWSCVWCEYLSLYMGVLPRKKCNFVTGIATLLIH